MKPRQPGQTPASTFAAGVNAGVEALEAAARNIGGECWTEQEIVDITVEALQRTEGRLLSSSPAALLPAITPDIAAFRLLGEARAIIAELTSPYWDHKAQGRAREWLRRYDEEEVASKARVAAVSRNSDGGSKGQR